MMTEALQNPNIEILSRHFTGVVCETPYFRDSRKIRQVLPWMGPILVGLASLGAVTKVSKARPTQMLVKVNGQRFKFKFQHAGLKSGIRVIRMQGRTHGDDVCTICSLAEAATFSVNMATLLV